MTIRSLNFWSVLLITSIVFLMNILVPLECAAIPEKMNIQGILNDKDGKPLANQTGIKIDMGIYDDPVQNTLLWAQSTPGVSTDSGGFYNVVLDLSKGYIGVNTQDTVFKKNKLYLAIEVNDKLLAPRQPLLSVPYAINSKNVVGDANNPGKVDVYNNDKNGIAIAGHAPFVGVYGTSETGTGVSGVGGTYGVYGWGGNSGVYAKGGFTAVNAFGAAAGVTAYGNNIGIAAWSLGLGGSFVGTTGSGISAETLAAGKAGVYGQATNEVSAGVQGLSMKGDGVIGESKSTYQYAGVHAINNAGGPSIRAEGGPIWDEVTSGGRTYRTTYMSSPVLNASVIDASSFIPNNWFSNVAMPLYLNTSGGRVIVGNADNTSYNFVVNGKAYASLGWFPASDKRFKTNIKPIANALEKVGKLNGVYYDWNNAFKNMHKNQGPWHREIGLVAQDVQKEFPELVTESGKEKYLALDYGRMTAVLVEAVKELKTKHDKLEAAVKKLEEKK